MAVARARTLANDIEADAMIIVAFRGDSFATTSYGRSAQIQRDVDKLAEYIHDDLVYGVLDVPQFVRRNQQRRRRRQEGKSD